MNTVPEHFLDSRDFARIARAIRYIERQFRAQPRLADVAAHAGLSEFHFNRLFRRWAGVTPKQYLTYVTGQAARDALRSQPVLDAAYSVGLSGPGRLHDLVVTLDAMTPGELKLQGRGAQIRHGFTDTPFGRALLGTTDRGICHLSFVEPAAEKTALRELQQRWPAADLELDERHARAIAERIWGSNGAVGQGGENGAGGKLAVSVGGTNFQLKVWQALLDLGRDASTTYTDVARAIGHPGGTRAVGNAVASNPVAWLIPCHNVLRKDGGLGGYHWGEDRKRAMHVWQSLPRTA
ncbi:MAG TPA: methylated-DNA--[protein]-cysteine S-methyltransferase [Steroidobacteraceae bacterium]|nr:methylated-DNA--[protein]-cysteine S-methyltransferase [Steroidobacteraceae bacterium]